MVGLVGAADHAHRSRLDGGFPADAFGERRLVTRPDGDLHAGQKPARRAVDQVHALTHEAPRQLDRLVDVPTALHPVGRRDAHEQRPAIRPARAHGARELQQDADAVLERSAVRIRAAVGKRREKFVQQVPVGGVQLQHAKAGADRAFRRVAKGLDDPRDPLAVELLGHRILGAERDRARRMDGTEAALFPRRQHAAALPGRLRGGFPAGASCIPATAP